MTKNHPRIYNKKDYEKDIDEESRVFLKVAESQEGWEPDTIENI